MNKSKLIPTLFGMMLLHTAAAVQAEEAAASAGPTPDSGATSQGTMPFSAETDTYQRSEQRIFPLYRDKLGARARELPPPFGVMFVTNWMNSDWEFQSAAVSLQGSNPISIDAAQDATMTLQPKTNGLKADLWVLPFLDLMVGAGKADIEADLGLRNIPLYYDPAIVRPDKYVYGDKIIPMNFSGNYYSVGGIVVGVYKRFYGALDFSWIKTSLNGDASLSEDGFWTFTAAPKIGYNAGLSQVYIGARYLSKNEHFVGTVPLASGGNLGFDVQVKTASWAGNFGIRTIIRHRWELLMESAIGNRYQITGGVGYRW